MIITSRLREYIAAVESAGGVLIDIKPTGGGHFKLSVSANDRRRFFVAASSSSTGRAIKNFKADVRRWVRGLQQ